MADNAERGGRGEEEEAVMPMQDVQEQSELSHGGNAADAIVPKDAARFAGQREALGELPVAPAAAAGAGEDAVMQDPEEDADEDGDDLFG